MRGRRIAIAFVALLLAPWAASAAAREALAPTDGAKRAKTWEKEIAAIGKRDAESTVPPGAIVFTGSSSIRLWDLAKWFPDDPVVNHGFGGSQICDATHFVEDLVLKDKPSVIVFYSGDNDIAGGMKAAQVHRDFQAFVAAVRKELPKTPIIVIATKPSLARWKLADEMRTANKLIADECAADETLTFLDVWPVMLGEDGQPRPEIFREDGLHMNDAGYEAWVKLLEPVLEKTYEAAQQPMLGKRLKPLKD